MAPDTPRATLPVAPRAWSSAPATWTVTQTARLRILQGLTVLVPAVCVGIYETTRHSILANDLPNDLGTPLAVAIVLVLSFGFARASFGIIHRMEARLLERNRRLEALSRDARRVATLEERERLAREIHDGVAQVVATILIRVDTVESLVSRGRLGEAAAELQDLRAFGDRANVEVREAIAGLRANPSPDADGLARALREYVEDFGARTGIHATFDGAGATPGTPGDQADFPFPPGMELHLVRIATEVLTNVRKHARARRVAVALHAPDATAPTWRLEVSDDGTGFDPAEPGGVAASPGDLRRRFGLEMVRERAASLGGTCVVESAPRLGTRVRVDVPHGAASGTRTGAATAEEAAAR